MIAALDRLPVQRPAWMRPLLVGTTLLFVLKFTGVIEVPDEWFWAGVAVEATIVVVELTVVVGVIRYFFVRHRAEGKDRLEAWVSAEIDEMKASGFPPRLAEQLGAIMRWEANLYRRIGRAVKRFFTGRGQR